MFLIIKSWRLKDTNFINFNVKNMDIKKNIYIRFFLGKKKYMLKIIIISVSIFFIAVCHEIPNIYLKIYNNDKQNQKNFCLITFISNKSKQDTMKIHIQF